MDIRSGQKLVWNNKVAKGYNTSDVPLEFCMLQEKASAAFEAWRKGRDRFGDEMADAVLYLMSLAELTGLDLEHEVETKIAKNSARPD